MKSVLLLIFIFITLLCTAQSFTESNSSFTGFQESAIAFSDVDGDNDLDVLLTGRAGTGNSGIPTAKLYTNDGYGNFTEEVSPPFAGVLGGAVAFSDIDGDEDEDVLITGWNGTELVSQLYINNGFGSFTEIMDHPIDGIYHNDMAFHDIDHDLDQDLLIAGWNGSVEITKLYTNDGNGNFTEVMDTPFVGVEFSAMDFADVNGDTHPDVLITGQEVGTELPTANLYLNDGNGVFTLLPNTIFTEVWAGSVAFSDVDGDYDKDVLITGSTVDYSRITKLYTNNGAGNFSEASTDAFKGISASSIAFSDIDGNSYQDLLITGLNDSLQLVSALYTNDGDGNFIEVSDTPFENVYLGSIAIADVNGDNHHDVFITGRGDSSKVSKLYINDGMASSIQAFVNTSNFEFKLYPNPTKADKVFINFDTNENSIIQVKIFDINGRLLKQLQEQPGIGKHTISTNISFLKKGSYIIQLDNGLRKSYQKLLIQ